MSNDNRYRKSTNPFECDDSDVDDETFLKNSRRTTHPATTITTTTTTTTNGHDQLQSLYERRKMIEDRTLLSTNKSLGILRDSEQIGIATANELMRQREQLEQTDKKLDEINTTLRFSQKHINGIKSVFSSLKNYMAGRNNEFPTPSSTTGTGPSMRKQQEQQPKQQPKQHHIINDNYSPYESHPTTRLRQETIFESRGGSKDFSEKLDANLQEMCSNISILKNLATDMSLELDTQNDLITNITDKVEYADININKQNKEMLRILKK